MTQHATPVLEAFFDYACPWSFVAFNRANEAAMRTLSQVEWRPVESKQLRQRLPDLSLPSAREQAYACSNWSAWLNYCGLNATRDYNAAVDSRAALLATLYATECGAEKPFAGAVFNACWVEGRDIADTAVLIELANDCGLDTDELSAWLEKPVVAEALERNLNDFMQLNGYKTPGFRVADTLFLGNEQMPLVELAMGQTSDLSFVMPGSHSWYEEDADKQDT